MGLHALPARAHVAPAQVIDEVEWQEPVVDEHAERLEDVAHCVERRHELAVGEELLRVRPDLEVHDASDRPRELRRLHRAHELRGRRQVARAAPLPDGERAEDQRDEHRHRGDDLVDQDGIRCGFASMGAQASPDFSRRASAESRE